MSVKKAWDILGMRGPGIRPRAQIIPFQEDDEQGRLH